MTTFLSIWGVSFPAFSQFTQTQPNAQLLVEQGRKLYETGQLSEAVTVLQQATDAFNLQKDELGKAMALSNLSLVFKQIGQWKKAEAAITQSLNLLKNSQLKTQNFAIILAQTLDIQGNLQLELGRTEQALDSWKQSADTYAQAGDEVGIIRSLINQSMAEQALGLYHQARTTLEELQPRLEQQPDSLVKATALRSFGDVLQLVGDLELSFKVLQQSQDIAKKLQSPSEISATLLSLGNTALALGNRQFSPQNSTGFENYTPLHCINRPVSTESVKFYQQATQFYEETVTTATSPLLQIQAQLNHLSVLLNLQQWSQAKKLSSEIQVKLTKIIPSYTANYAQIHFAQNLVCLKQATNADIPSWKEIAEILAKSIEQAQSMDDERSVAYALGALGGLYLENQDLVNAQKLSEQALTLAQAIKAGDIAYLWQWQLGYILRIKGDMTGAIASYTEAVNTLKYLRNDLITLNPDIQFSFRDNIEPVYRQLVDLLLQPASTVSTKKSISQKNLKQARGILETLQLAELENFFREACLKAAPEQIDEVVDKTDATAAVIYPIILADHLDVILKLPNQAELAHYTLKKKPTEIKSILENLQLYLRQPDRVNDVNKLSQQVYSWLIQPLESELARNNIKTLVFVLDGELRNIPMAVLYDRKHQQYLIQKYAISLAPGLQLIEPKSLQKVQLNGLIAGVSEQRQIEGRSFSPLKNVEVELKQIRSAIPKNVELFNQTFTKINLENQVKKIPYTVVHIATHGEFSSNPDKTFILTWEQLLKVKDFDNLIRLSGQRESNAIELLVLSACETAQGDNRATLGLAGIAVRAGARSTLATLWTVNDESTAEFMSQFYQELENNKVTKAEALRRAQLKLLTDYEIPYFWAPYILVGNWL
ncbi:MAG: CHAT domain-containing protein [Nostoc sp. CmiVER01]|uniref:CHAT domain-containing protein n=1 Tax=Nostoc sp. CmiVER01 TaxID=3075384 RepID=UPI002AD4F499|nr:CHAT domain-containing protein [Nostoc sp. CmiVER01]MDZ8126607.1 CHAT domain-containing protein [Nostoc sp. CmiVER01]